MVGRKTEEIPFNGPPNPDPEAVGKGPSSTFDTEEDDVNSEQQDAGKNVDDLKPGSLPDGTASGVGNAPNREPGIEQVEEANIASSID